MKTLRKYVVNGGLYAGDAKTPAAVGDQVRLYLDTEAHEDFPEFTIGTVQHPVAPLYGGTAVSYSFEYDEADLDGIVANLIVDDVISVEVIAVGGVTDHTLLTGRDTADAHPTSAITGLDSALAAKQPLDADLTAYAEAADAEARRALIGAGEPFTPLEIVGADPGDLEDIRTALGAQPETTESVLALLEGESISAFIELGDSSGQVLIPEEVGNKTLARKGNLLHLDDGTTSRPVTLLSGQKNHVMSTGGDKEFVVFETFTIKAGTWVNDDMLQLFGTVRAKPNSIVNRTSVKLMLRPDTGSTDAKIRFPAVVATRDCFVWDLCAQITINDAAGVSYLIANTGSSVLVTTPTDGLSVATVEDDFGFTGVTANDLTVNVGIFVDTSDAALAGNLLISWNFGWNILNV